MGTTNTVKKTTGMVDTAAADKNSTEERMDHEKIIDAEYGMMQDDDEEKTIDPNDETYFEASEVGEDTLTDDEKRSERKDHTSGTEMNDWNEDIGYINKAIFHMEAMDNEKEHKKTTKKQYRSKRNSQLQRQGKGRGYGRVQQTHRVQNNTDKDEMDEDGSDEEEFDLQAIVRGKDKPSSSSDSSLSDTKNKSRQYSKTARHHVTEGSPTKQTKPSQDITAGLYNVVEIDSVNGQHKNSEIIVDSTTITVDTSAPRQATATSSYNNDESSEATTKTGWTSTKSSRKPIPSDKTYNIGVHVSKLVQHDEGGFHPDDIRMLLDLIQQQDPEVLFIPHNNNAKLARTWKQLPANYNYSTMMNVKSMPWGKPTDNKTKAELSFYIASDTIPSIKQLTTDIQIQHFLATTNLRLGFHSLHESSRKSIGFLLGKSVTKAYWNDIAARLNQHIDDSLILMKKMSSTTDNKQKQLPIPTKIPIQLNPTTLVIGDATTKALSIFVGVKDKTTIERLLQKYPFPDVEIVAEAWKRSNPEVYANRIDLHNLLEENSTAIKITETTPDMRAFVKHNRHKADCANLIVDIAEGRDTPTTGVIYVQCLAKDKATVLLWVQAILENIDSTHTG
jgi:hypothetical protein